MKRRNLKLLINKSGRGTEDYRITLPTKWIKEMQLSSEDRKVIVSFEDNKIIIEKGEIKMFEVIKFFDVYRKDLLNKYGSDNYGFYGDYNVTTEEVLAKFATEKEAKEFAKKQYDENTEKYSVSGNNIYLVRYDILKLEDEDCPETVETFGLSLEEYEKIN